MRRCKPGSAVGITDGPEGGAPSVVAGPDGGAPGVVAGPNGGTPGAAVPSGIVAAATQSWTECLCVIPWPQSTVPVSSARQG